MDDSGHARIADFGLSMVTKDLTSIPSARLQHGSTPRWAAPELMEHGIYEKEADVFSFAMVMIEVYCGWRPLWKISLLKLHINIGLYWFNSIQKQYRRHSHVGYSARGTPRTANASEFHGKTLVVDATVLEWQPWRAA